MMVQDILTYLVIFATVLYAGYKIYQSLRPSEKNSAACGSGCSCNSDRIKGEITKVKPL